MKKIEKLTNFELLQELDFAIRIDHYDSMGDRKSDYSIVDLRAEVFKRMAPRPEN